jgi:hypothetical protein
VTTRSLEGHPHRFEVFEPERLADTGDALAFERGEHPQDNLVFLGATIAHRPDRQA